MAAVRGMTWHAVYQYSLISQHWKDISCPLYKEVAQYSPQVPQAAGYVDDYWGVWV